MFNAIAFAGAAIAATGGRLLRSRRAPGPRAKFVVGASAGAFAACYSLLGIGDRVRELVIGGCGDHLKNFDLELATRPAAGPGPLYRHLLANVIDEGALARLNAFDRSAGGDLAERPARAVAGRRRRSALPPTRSRRSCCIPIRGLPGNRSTAPSSSRARTRRSRAASPPCADGAARRHCSCRSTRSRAALPSTAGCRQRAGRNCWRRSKPKAGARDARLQNIPKIDGRTYFQPSQDSVLGQFDITNPHSRSLRALA